MSQRTLAILGAGPIGIEAAAAAASLGFDVRVFERGEVGSAVHLWGHVRMFTPWRDDRSRLGARMAREAGALATDGEARPTGDELLAQYLLPLTHHPLLRGRFETGTKVLAVGREQLLKSDLVDPERRRAQRFRLLVERDGVEKVVMADAVIDATGTSSTPAWLGPGGTPALGERHAMIARHLPDVLGRDRVSYEGARVLVVGGGLSAATVVCQLAELAKAAPQTRVVWAVRCKGRSPVARVPDDPFPARDAIAAEANALADGGSAHVELRPATQVELIFREDDGRFRVALGGPTGAVQERFDRVVALVGYRPDRALWDELHVEECFATGGPMGVALRLLGRPCRDGAADGDPLALPEPDFLVLGAKSYGRLSTRFLLTDGHAQVRDAFRLLTGNPALDLA